MFKLFQKIEFISVIHNIARHVSEFAVWMKKFPPHLSTVILAESAILS